MRFLWAACGLLFSLSALSVPGFEDFSPQLEPKGSFGVGFTSYSLEDPWHPNVLMLEGGKEQPAKRRILVNLWYPSTKKMGPMLHRDYFESEEGYAREFLRSYRKWRQQAVYADMNPGPFAMMSWHKPVPAQMPDIAADQRPTGVTRGAPWAPDRYPLIFYHASAVSSFEENAPLLEFLVSHGFAVAAVIGPSEEGIIDATQRLEDLAWNDVVLASEALKKEPHLDFGQISLMGFSSGAQKSLDFALKRGDFKSIVLLDTTYENQDFGGMNPEVKKAIVERGTKMRTPVLVLAGIDEQKQFKGNIDRFRIYTPLAAAPVVSVDIGDQLSHNDFGWVGLVARSVENPFNAAEFEKSLGNCRFTAKLVLQFLQGSLDEVDRFLDQNRTQWVYKKVRSPGPSAVDPDVLNAQIRNLRSWGASAEALKLCQTVPVERLEDVLVCAAAALDSHNLDAADRFVKAFRKPTDKSWRSRFLQSDAKILKEAIKKARQ